MIQAYLGDQAFKTHSPFRAGGGLAQVVVDEQDPLFGPAQSLGSSGEAVLQPRGLFMIQDLLGGVDCLT